MPQGVLGLDCMVIRLLGIAVALLMVTAVFGKTSGPNYYTQEQIDLCYIGPLAPGFFDYEEEVGQRMIRSITFLRDHPNDSQWAHPVEGLLTTLNLTTGEVVSILDEGDVPTATGSGAYDDEAIGERRDDLMPLEPRGDGPNPPGRDDIITVTEGDTSRLR